MGRLGELLAARFLASRGVVVVGRNLRVGKGEIDVLGREGDEPVAVEVKTVVVRHRGDDGIFQATPAKLDAVRRAARRLDPPVHRVDLVTVALAADGVALRWIRDVGW